MKLIQPGIYQHYKGNRYRVHKVAIHSESAELFVVYQPLYGEKKWWVRPYTMFIETLLVNGESVPRFKRLKKLTSS